MIQQASRRSLEESIAGLSQTVAQEEIDSFLTPAQQKSLLRIKQRFFAGDKDFDVMLANMASYDKEAIDAFLCPVDFIFFCSEFCRFNDVATESVEWPKFKLWPIQQELAEKIRLGGKTLRLVVPKSRQMGKTWKLGCAKPIWKTLYRPNFTSVLYSRSEQTVLDLLGHTRLGGMLDRLPKHIIPEGVEWQTTKKNRTERHFSNGSVIYARNPRQGDGLSSKYTFIDEADMFEDLDHTLSIVLPATEHGQLVMASRSNKDNGESRFKKLCREAAYNPDNTEWQIFFTPWHSHPGRDQGWYDREFRSQNDIDFMYSNYPNTLEEFLAPRQLNKRIPVEHLSRCRGKGIALKTNFKGRIRHPRLIVYQEPSIHRKYYIGVDTAEGLDHGDNSCIMVIDDRGEDVANITSKMSPAYQASLVRDLSKVYNNARVLVENNSIGAHAIHWLQENGCRHLLMKDRNSRKLGWTTTERSKAALYVNLAELVQNEEAVINDGATFDELQSINKDTLKAPRGNYDDRAVGYALAQMARTLGARVSTLRIIDLTW